MPAEHINLILERSLAELQKAILKRRALLKLDPGQVDMYLPAHFFYLCFDALKHDIWWHAFRVFDVHPNARAWKFMRTKALRAEITAAAKALGVSIPWIRRTAARLLHIRNLTRAHIDMRSVLEPEAPYNLANVAWRELDALVGDAFKVLSAVATARGVPVPEIDFYDAADVHKIIRAYSAADPEARVRLRPSADEEDLVHPDGA